MKKLLGLIVGLGLGLLCGSSAFAWDGVYVVDVSRGARVANSAKGVDVSGVSCLAVVDLAEVDPEEWKFSFQLDTVTFQTGNATGNAGVANPGGTGISDDSGVTVPIYHAMFNDEVSRTEVETLFSDGSQYFMSLSAVSTYVIGGTTRTPVAFTPTFGRWLAIIAHGGCSAYYVPSGKLAIK